jgi:pimeloyl-ACP methyl ester carboxylesterase
MESKKFDPKLVGQFDSPAVITVSKQEIRVVDIAPDILKNDIPVIFAPGFSAVAWSLKDPILSVAEQGRRVISYYAAHGVPTNRNLGGLPVGQMRKLEVLLAIVEQKKLAKVNIIANSEAAVYATVFANLYPEKVGSVVLITPAGLMGKDSIFAMIYRFILDMLEDRRLKSRPLPNGFAPTEFSVSLESGIAAIRADLKASLYEVRGMAKFDLAKNISEATNKGVKFAIIHSEQDRLFPLARIKKNLPDGLVSIFEVVWGTHNAVYNYKPYGQIAERTLSLLEAKKLN